MELPVRLSRTAATNTALTLGVAALDSMLGGGVETRRLHEIVPAGPFHLGAAAGFALGLAARMERPGAIVWIQQGIAALEGGAPYAMGLDLFGIAPARQLMQRARAPRDALWAMEESLRCPGVCAVIGEMSGAGEAADLTATRRLNLVAEDHGALPLLLRQQALRGTSACATRWRVHGLAGRGDGFGGIGRTAFMLALEKNRHGSCGDWRVEWDHEQRKFRAAFPVAVASPSLHRPHHAA